MSHPCDHHAPEISALLDGEVDQQRLLGALDHLIRCPACRSFYRRARALDGTVALLRRQDEEASSLPGDGWEAIRRRSGHRLARRRPPAWALRLAAGLLLAGGLLWGVLSLSRPPLPPAGAVLDVQVEGDRGRMDEERFLEITAELLRADRRYHLALEKVLAEVNRRNFGREGSVEARASTESAGRRPRV